MSSSTKRSVVLELRFEDELVELLQLRATATRPTDCLPGFGCQDRVTMILAGSFVNRRGSQPAILFSITFGWRGDEGTINVWHSLRHSYGTWLVAKGAHGEEIQRLMGHKDYRTTQRYIQVTKEQLAATVRRVFG